MVSNIISVFFLSDTDEELKNWKNNFEGIVAKRESDISKLEREKNDMDTKIKFLEQNIDAYTAEITNLLSEAGVIFIELITYDIVKLVQFI